MKDCDRNKVMRILVEGITRNLEGHKDFDVVINGIEIDEDLVVVIKLDLNGTFLTLPLLRAISRILGDEDLWVCSWGNDGLKVTATYKKTIENIE